MHHLAAWRVHGADVLRDEEEAGLEGKGKTRAPWVGPKLKASLGDPKAEGRVPDLG